MSRPKLIVMCGLSASGKSTIAKELAIKHNACIVSSDSIREEICRDVADQSKNEELFKIFHKRIREYLNTEFGEEYGIEVLDASIIDVHPDDKLKESIDARVKALQEKQQAEAEQEKIKVQKETEKMQAEADAQIEITKAQAEAEANRLKSESITDELIRMKEAEAHMQHGFVTVQGANTVVKE